MIPAQGSPVSNALGYQQKGFTAVATKNISRWVFVVGAGVLSTNLSQPQVLDIPIRALLITEFGLAKEQMAIFFAVGALPWYLKMPAGFLVDNFPLFESRRRSYLILSMGGASFAWILLAYFFTNYNFLLLLIVGINSLLVVASATLGGLLADLGQKFDAANRIASARIFVDSACSLIAGPLAGGLASLPFYVTGLAGAALAFVFIPISAFLLDKAIDRPCESQRKTDLGANLSASLGARKLWAMAALLFFFEVPQAIYTSFYYYQTVELKLTADTIGNLRAIGALGSMAAIAAYGLISPRIAPRSLIIVGIVSGSAALLTYRFYFSFDAALVVEGPHGFFLTFGSLAFMEAAIWSVPRTGYALGFAILMSASNAGSAIGDILTSFIAGSWSVEFITLTQLAGLLAILLLWVVPILPNELFARKPHSV